MLALAGDAMLGRGVDKRFSNNPAFDPWKELAPALRDVDLFAMNLECVITDSTDRWPHKAYNFRLKPDNVARALDGLPLPQDAARFASFANNHALDYGRPGLADTLAQLAARGWATAGTGATASEAQRPALITTDTGVRIGVLAIGDHCSCRSTCAWMAGEDRSGAWYANLSGGQWQHLLEAVSNLDTEVDLVLVSLHAGPNYTHRGAPRWLRRLAAALVASGADVVFAHSAHHVLPVEVIDGRHVFYGLGDLVHDYPRRPEYDNDLGFVAKITIAADGTQTLEPVPYRIRQKAVHPLQAKDPDHAEVLRRAQWPGR